MSIRALAIILLLSVFAGDAQAVLSVTNGDFENLAAAALIDVPDWFDYDGDALAWWQQASVDNAPGISPFQGDSAYLFLSGLAPDGLATWAYQNVGTNSTGLDSVFVNFNYGALDDAPFPRNRTITFDLFQSDGSFIGMQNVDITGSAGITLLDSQSFTTGPLAAGVTGFTNLELDLTQAGMTNDLWLRVSSSAADDTDPFVGIDNISLTEAPILLPPTRLEVNRDTGDFTLINDDAAVKLVQYTITATAGNLVEANWAPIADNGDSDSGGSIDTDDTWEVTLRDINNLSEEDVLGVGMDDGAPFSGQIPIGSGVWQKYFDEADLEVSILTCTICDGSDDVTKFIPAYFVGNNDQPFLRSDFDFDNDIDADDFQVLLSNQLVPMDAALSDYESYALGDINGNQVNNAVDFRLFKNDFIAANGEAAFATLLAGTAVPEPAGAAQLLGVLALAAVAVRSRLSNLRLPLAVGLLVACLCTTSRQAQAVLSITNGDFETGAGAFLTDVPNWFDYNGGELAWWQQASQDNTPAISPFDGDSSYLFLSGADAALGFWAYQGIGTNSDGKSSIYVNFDAGTLDDAGATPLTRLLNFELYQSDGTYAGGMDDVDIVGAAGVTLVDSFSIPTGPLFAGDTVSLSGELDLSSVGATNDLFLRVSNSSIAGTPHYVGIDNITLSDSPLNATVTPGFRLEVNTTTGEIGLRNLSGSAISIDRYEIRSEAGGLSSTGWSSFADQGIDALDGPDADEIAGSTLGETWAEVGGVAPGQTSTGLLAELFLGGDTTFGVNEFKTLGNGYNTSVADMALTFGYSTSDGILYNVGTGLVAYDPVIIPPTGLLGDFNNDGTVNLADYTVWRNNLGSPDTVLPDGTTNDGSGFVDVGDYATWKANFGAMSSGGVASTANVPEPGTAGLCLAVAMSLVATLRRRQQRK